MVLRSRAARGVLAVALLSFHLFAAVTNASLQLLQNGGFEGGASGWSLVNASPSGCQPRSGSVALQLSPTPQSLAAAQQEVRGVASGLGPYVLTGYSKVAAGSANAKIALRWLDSSGGVLADDEAALALGPAYAAFAANTQAAPSGSAALLVRIIASGGPGSICVDDISLDGPPPVTLTPSPTATPVPTWTPIPTETPTKTPNPTRTASPTRTPAPPTATKTARPATATRAPSSTMVPGGVQDTLTNGGFEAGLAPWQKFGGELRTVSSPAHSGALAGALSSTTSSTKWAFQSVAVQAGETYEFSGFLLPDAGVSEAFLRVSWYASPDSSGSMIGSVDSTARVAGGVPSYVYLTTEGVTAPDGAASARLRAMLTPAAAGPAVLYLDDFAFGPAEPVSHADSGLVTPPAHEEDDVDSASTLSDRPPAEGGTGFGAVPSPAATAQVRGTRATQVPVQQSEARAGPAPGGDNSAVSPVLYVLAASLLTAGAMGGAFWYGRRTGRG